MFLSGCEPTTMLLQLHPTDCPSDGQASRETCAETKKLPRYLPGGNNYNRTMPNVEKVSVSMTRNSQSCCAKFKPLLNSSSRDTPPSRPKRITVDMTPLL